MSVQQYCTCFLDDLCFGVDVGHIQEVLRLQEMTPVPHAPPTIRGLINLRGQIVTAIDLRRRLDLPERRTEGESVCMVIRTGDLPVSLLVDEIGDVIDVPEDMLEPPPETLTGTASALISGTYPLTDQLLLVLDIANTVSGLRITR